MLTGQPRFPLGCTCGMARNLRKATPVDGMKAAFIGTAPAGITGDLELQRTQGKGSESMQIF